MPSYVSGGNFKQNKQRTFHPSIAHYYNKHKAVDKLVDLIHGKFKRKPLEKALGKMNTEDVVLLGMVIDNAIEKEIEARKQSDE